MPKKTKAEESPIEEPTDVDVEALKNQVPDAQPESAGGDRIAELEAALIEKEALLKEADQKVLRVLADSENFRKRKEHEKEEFMKYANEKVVVELLPVMDSFDQALKLIDGADETKGEGADTELAEGVRMIHKQLWTTLEKWGVVKIDGTDEPFDPMKHQAVSQEDNESVAPQTVLRVMQAGYRLHERIVRPSMVVVSK